MSHQDEINDLYRKLGELTKKQALYAGEIEDLRIRIDLLQASAGRVSATPESTIAPKPAIERAAPVTPPVVPAIEKPLRPAPQPNMNTAEKRSSDLEKFIGENLINKIGILITVIGVGIGAKYAIDHNLISPVTRIILGYLVGGGLLAFALRLKKKYEDFSAVLLSGSMAIFYCITYLAYAFYSMYPNSVAFVLMLLFTVFTVGSAIKYNKQVIAHIGLVGAYAVPFLLNEGSGRIGIFFTYMAIINIGILVISLKKYWKPLYFVSFAFTWIIFISWFAMKYYDHLHFTLTAFFLFVFFAIFYITTLCYKLLRKESFDIESIGMIFLNAFIFYGVGCFLIDGHAGTEKYMGLFTLLNALLHFGVCAVLYKRNLADRSLLDMTVILSMLFVTIAIPIQFRGEHITIAWTLEALVLFLIGRTRRIPVLEFIAFPVIIFTFISLCLNWTWAYFWHSNFLYSNKVSDFIPLFNIHFLTGLFFAATLFFIRRVSKSENFTPAMSKTPAMLVAMDSVVYILLLITVFFACRLEISHYWNARYITSGTINMRDTALQAFSTISSLLFALVFVSTLAWLRRKTNNNELFNLALFIGFQVAILAFLTTGLYDLNSLQLKYLEEHPHALFYRGPWLVFIRYIAFGILACSIFQLLKFVKAQLPSRQMRIASEYILHTVIVWCASAELVSWMHLINSAQSYKLGLSIFWGLYSLLLIILGIRYRKSYLRIGAFSLFGITLFKLFFYDISHLNTISKTIVFVSLGILLLVISFLYNKYRNIMFEQEDKQEE